MELPNPKDAIPEILSRIIGTAKPKKIILFGSFARGDQNKDSDLDILVIEEKVESKYRESIRIKNSLSGILVPIDILVVSEAEFENRSKNISTVYYWAKIEGTILYEAA